MGHLQRTSTTSLVAMLALLAAQVSEGLTLCCEEITTKLDNMTADREGDLAILMKKLQDVAQNVNEINSKMDRMKIDFHHDLESMKNGTVGLAENRVTSTEEKEQVRSNVNIVNTTISNTDSSVNTMVDEYSRNSDWPSLWMGLYSVLDNQSAAFEQLLNVSREEIRPLWQVGFSGSLDLAALLLDAGLKADKRDSEGYTMLHGAAQGGQLFLAEVLLNCGANLEARNRWGSTPLLLATSDDQLKMIQWLVARGADVNSYGNDGWTSLHQAASSGNLDIVRLLVEAGSDIAAKDNTGNTPLDFATSKKLPSIVEYLSQYPY